MTATEQAIKEAVEKGGWRPPFNLYRAEREVGFGKLFWQMYSGIFLDPLFWQALGKARNWGNEFGYDNRTFWSGTIDAPEVSDEGHAYREIWKWKWHCFIDHLGEGEDAESFFKTLLTNK